MPRKPDARLEGRILDAAYHLWTKGGEDALTMRAVARAARTTTPTLYQRFRDKDILLKLLRAHAVDKLVCALEPADTAAGTCRLFLEFAQRHPNEYRLLVADWAVRLSRKDRKPSFELIKSRLAKDLGGAPAQHTRLALSLGEILHGTATMLLAEGVHERVAKELRDACLGACESMIEHASREPARWKSTDIEGMQD
ncbi:MAG TPA: helix-turn-helix domain-containing protein [Verrucomicrobiae bacterium]|nr:helix-turn-helix domain-containing protein [Verrucomicrobiae bacterium]